MSMNLETICRIFTKPIHELFNDKLKEVRGDVTVVDFDPLKKEWIYVQ